MKYLYVVLLVMISTHAQAVTAVKNETKAGPGGDPEALIGRVDCQCRFSTGSTWGSGVLVKDWGVISQETRGIPFTPSSAENKCKAKCTQKAKDHMPPNTAAFAQVGVWACQAGSMFQWAANEHQVHAISKAGFLASGGIDYTLGTIFNLRAVYSCPQGGTQGGIPLIGSPVCTITQPSNLGCPSGYSLDASSSKCFKQMVAVNTLPGCPNGVAIGAGVIGNVNGEYKTDNDDGIRFWINATRNCNPDFTLVGTECKKTYAATLVTPARCGIR